MGAVCCCSRDDWEDFVNPNSSVYRNCVCVSCVVQNVLNMYTTLFRRGESQSMPSYIQGPGSFTSTSSLDDPLDMYHSPPRPLPYDVDTRYIRLQRDVVVASRPEKGSSHSHDESEPLRRGDIDADSELLISRGKLTDSTRDEGLKDYNSRPSLRLSSAKAAAGYAHMYSSSEDEDVCPTCLEEYTTENPRIVTKCSHHYHLGCIYEWMERSDSCPVCGKVMLFDETT